LLHAYKPPPTSFHKLYILPAHVIYLSDNSLIAQRLSYSGRELSARRFASLSRVGLRACELSIQSFLGLIKVKRSQYQLIFVKYCLLFKTVISCTSMDSKDISFFPPNIPVYNSDRFGVGCSGVYFISCTDLNLRPFELTFSFRNDCLREIQVVRA
jgi:hypothetical protein